MVKINGAGNIEVKDVDRAYFKLQLKLSKFSRTVDLDLDPTDYMPGGKCSSGLFVTDVGSYITHVFNNMISGIGVSKKISIEDLRTIHLNIAADGSYFNDEYGPIELNGLDYSKEFSSHLFSNIKESAMFYSMFLVDSVSSIEYNSVTSSLMLSKSASMSATNLVSALIRVYLYSYSQQCRDLMVAQGLYKIVFNAGAKCYKGARVVVYDRYIDDFIKFDDDCTFIARNIYPLSSSNRSTSSDMPESMSYNDLVYIRKSFYNNRISEDNPDLVFVTTKLATRSDTYRAIDRVFMISGYKTIDGDCLLSTTISAKYDILPTTISEALVCMFNQPYARNMINMFSILIDPSSIGLTHDDIVFDKDIDEIIESKYIKLELCYATYTKSGGARRTEYKDLCKKKISPVTRRDGLYDICYNLMSIANINKTKAFKKLDVDFKRFYGYSA